MWRQNKIQSKKATAGFTLLEVLLALGIFSSLSLAANQVLRNVLVSNEQSLEVGDELKSLQRLIFIMDSDFRQMVARSYRNNGQETPEQMLEMEQGLLDSESYGIRFARGGFINPQQLFDRGEVIKVGYRVQNETLERLRWVYPDDSAAYEPAISPLFEGMSEIRFAASQDGQSWSENWENKNEMPKALRVTFATKRYGELTRIYLLPVSAKLNEQESQGDEGLF